MKLDSLDEILRFAIRKEADAAAFYKMAADRSNPGVRKTFKELAKEEEGHRKLLENLSMEKVAQSRIETIPNLKISDYLVETEFRPDMSYAEILRMAMKMEEHSLKLDNDLKNSSTDEGIRRLFTFLAGEEAKHKLRLEKIYDEEILK